MASTPRDVAASSDVVCVVVLDDAQVRDVMLGADGLLAADRKGLVVAIHATVHLDTVLEVAAESKRRGVDVVDAGVSGSVGGAEQGQLAVMAGGDANAFERCRPVFACYGGLVLRMGDLGAGMFERRQQTSAQADRVVQRLERYRVLVHTGDAEAGRHGTGGDDEEVVGFPAITEQYFSPVDVDAGHFRHQYAHVLLAPENATDRPCNLRR